jgi:hypothetical protein
LTATIRTWDPLSTGTRDSACHNSPNARTWPRPLNASCTSALAPIIASRPDTTLLRRDLTTAPMANRNSAAEATAKAAMIGMDI